MRTWTHSLWCSNAPGCALLCTRCSWCVFLDMECARLGRALLDAHFAVLRTCFSVCVPSCASDCTCLWSARMLEMRTLLSMRCARLRGVHSSVLAPRRILLGVCSFSWLFYLFFFLVPIVRCDEGGGAAVDPSSPFLPPPPPPPSPLSPPPPYWKLLEAKISWTYDEIAKKYINSLR